MDPLKRFLNMRLEEKMALFSACVFVLVVLLLFFENGILEGIIAKWGIPGLFIVAFFSSTIFIAFPLEGLFPILLQYTDAMTMVAVAAAGSLLGTWVNYGLGLLGSKVIKERYEPQQLERAKKLMDKYGWFGLLVVVSIPLPGLPVDPLTIVPGIVRMNPVEFTAAVFIGKLIKYSIVAAAILGLVNGFL